MLCENKSGSDPLTDTSPNHGKGRSFHTSPPAQLPDLSHLNTLQDNHIASCTIRKYVSAYIHARHSGVVISLVPCMHACTYVRTYTQCIPNVHIYVRYIHQLNTYISELLTGLAPPTPACPGRDGIQLRDKL